MSTTNQTFDFSNVEEAGIPMTPPGVIDLFDITDMKFGLSSQKATPEVEVTFVQQNKASSFRKRYFFSPKAMPSLQHLFVKATGAKFADPAATEEQIIAKLKGKRTGLKVIGRVADNGGGYPDLGFAGFACTVSEFAAFKAAGFTEAEKKGIEAAIIAQATSRSSNADADGTPSGGTGGAGAKSEDPF